MKFVCPLIAVSDIEASKNFYGKVLNQKVTMDFGANVTFENGFAIQKGFAELIDINENEVAHRSNNFELYFEEEDLNGFVERLKSFDNIEYVHDVKEHPWGQRVIRFYDPDKHIIEVGESMVSVIKRFLSQGLTPEETAKRTMFPIEFIQKLV
ncbi:glyoxalase [Clostridium carboxidivorans P7]|uniref:Glyoxalase/bleomycin resistance protein/dioxygenase n=1 Tax=Clostridium carboxidivorans P7 TaxID=536227 RepID=C6Q166_9CLOT|nr:VOC family protein [Clostridium carboxidivorans]AKN30260.1 glyoxalase [Clostridium carboxidivorans P7]EET84766.1 Glyoxalase/bleomycin resistance protein/dioxygenase [Clostridium carboxidivorans P7]